MADSDPDENYNPCQELNDLVKFKETEDEWEQVAEITPQFNDGESAQGQSRDQPPQAHAVSPLVTVDEALHYVNSGVLDGFLSQVSEPTPSTLDQLMQCLCWQPLLPHLESTKQTIQATALLPFHNEEPIHLGILRTIYRQLTGSRVDCPRYGSHWEDIGFQGTDPSTDLRGVGFLGLVQMLYLVMTPEIIPFSRDVYSLSRKDSQEFPLMVLSLNATRISLHILRDGILDKQISQDNDAWTSFNFLYGSVLYFVYNDWKTNYRTISNSGFVLKVVEDYARKNVSGTIAQFETFLTANYSVAVKQAARQQLQLATQSELATRQPAQNFEAA